MVPVNQNGFESRAPLAGGSGGRRQNRRPPAKVRYNPGRPPYSIKQGDRSAWERDKRGRNFLGTAPQGRADYAFQQHILASLRDVFVRAYERSCQQYVAVHQQLVPPDALRLRYRAQLSRLVAAIVRAHAAADEATIRAHLPETVAEGDRERFIALALDEFNTLHAGNAIRFGLRPLEFAAWRGRRGEHD